MTVEEQAIEQAAKTFAGFDKSVNIDFDERYFRGHDCDRYDAFIAGSKSPEAEIFHIKGMYSWDEINMMLSAFICEYCPETSSEFSPGMFINKYFEQNKKK